MFELRKIPVLRVLLPFFGGVVTGTVVCPAVPIRELVLISLLIWLLAVMLYALQVKRAGPAGGILSPLFFLLFFLAGLGSGSLTVPVDPGLPTDEWLVIRGEVTGVPQEGNTAQAYDFELYMLCSDTSVRLIRSGLKVYLSDSILPSQGELWQFYGRLAAISNSGNPGAPDFRSVMGRRNCWYRFYISSDQGPAGSNRLVREEEGKLTPALIREKVSAHWHGETEEVSLLKAVCLGDRSRLTDDLKQAYTIAGGMHLLAVSGLHVGLIWWVLHYMTRWMTLLFGGDKQRVVTVIGLLWFYAFVTGFSSSVCRSVTMFTFFTISRMMGQRIHSLNGILVSAFLLVLIEPVRLLDVGFQLSYAAIIGIVCLHPVACKRIRTKNPLLRRVLEATSVSLSAQLSTAPLVIFYFHQIPLFSFLTSLVSVPLLSLMIGIFVISVPFVSAGILEEFFNFLLIKLAFVMNHTMQYLSGFPGAMLEGLQVDKVSLSTWLLLLFFMMMALHSRSRIPRYLLILLTAGLLTWNSLTLLRCKSSSELVITHFRRATMVIIRQGKAVDHYCWYGDTLALDYLKAYRNVSWSRRVYDSELHEPVDSPEIRGKTSFCKPVAEGIWLVGCHQCSGLVVRGTAKEHVFRGIYGDSLNNSPRAPDFILFSGEPKVEYLQQTGYLGKTDLVLDGSNRSWYKDRMRTKWDGFYLTDRSGAYVKRW